MFTLRRGPTIQTKMSLAIAGIYCMISLHLSGAMKDPVAHWQDSSCSPRLAVMLQKQL